MMLPQHKEALIERRNLEQKELKRARVPTREELEMIRDAMLLPVVLTIVEQNGRDLLLNQSPLKKLYIAAAQVLLDRIHADLVRINKELRDRKIKVYRDDREDSDLHYRYIIEGYEDKLLITRDVAKATISKKIGDRIYGLIGDLKKE
ncbi:hypothetical protein WMW72_12015 [Paenibacillus filicis]|uniref:Uncharacterized protein n=1 Tax=Paenibacillus filicis TaxID=669464 RepID=A0ABU9DIE2_9BACL